MWGVECQRCLAIIVSRSTHDFRYCPCGASFVDGGRNYTRYGGDPMPRMVEVPGVGSPGQ